MSKDKPEVGDVWKSKELNFKVHIISIFGNMPFVLYINEDNERDYFPLETFLEAFDYIGKAKAIFEDLFKTENE